MSMTYSTFSCSRCDYEGLSCISWGFFNYDTLADVWIDRHLGVCRACCQVAPVERLDTLAARLAELGESVQLSRFEGLLHSLGIAPRSARRKQALARSRDDILALMELDRPPACLACGSQDFEAIRWPDDYIEDGRLFRLEMDHPGCGGDLLVHGSDGARLGVDLVERRYDMATGRQVSGPKLSELSFSVAYTPRARAARWQP